MACAGIDSIDIKGSLAEQIMREYTEMLDYNVKSVVGDEPGHPCNLMGIGTLAMS